MFHNSINSPYDLTYALSHYSLYSSLPRCIAQGLTSMHLIILCLNV